MSAMSDYISRQAALDALWRAAYEMGKKEAEAERKRGKGGD